MVIIPLIWATTPGEGSAAGVAASAAHLSALTLPVDGQRQPELLLDGAASGF